MPDQHDRPTGHIVTGAEYVEQVTARRSDRRARAAFRDLVLSIARPGATLFDFGAGTGLDAQYYAAHGFNVVAYDVDPRMRDFFAEYCQDFIRERRIAFESGDYREFLARESLSGGRQADLITANFAPLNLIEDLNGLFAKFHAISPPGGQILASVLSPYFLGDLRYPWWWRNLPSLMREGRFSVPGAQAPIVRRGLADFAAASAPYFSLRSAFRGSPARRRRALNGRLGGAWLGMTTSRYMFLVFCRM